MSKWLKLFFVAIREAYIIFKSIKTFVRKLRYFQFNTMSLLKQNFNKLISKEN